MGWAEKIEGLRLGLQTGANSSWAPTWRDLIIYNRVISEQPYPMLSAVFYVILGELSQGTRPMLRNFLWEDVGRETSRTKTSVVEQDI